MWIVDSDTTRGCWRLRGPGEAVSCRTSTCGPVCSGCGFVRAVAGPRARAWRVALVAPCYPAPCAHVLQTTLYLLSELNTVNVFVIKGPYYLLILLSLLDLPVSVMLTPRWNERWGSGAGSFDISTDRASASFLVLLCTNLLIERAQTVRWAQVEVTRTLLSNQEMNRCAVCFTHFLWDFLHPGTSR